jgi:cellulose synthase (UDP-forming)
MAVGIVALACFFYWLYGAPRRGDAWLFWPLAIAMTYRGLWWVLEWINFARPKVEPFVPPQRQWTVDVLTTACPGEPRGMILRTMRAMQAIRYPHTSYLCDEGNDPVLREACRQLGIIHVTREVKTHAKAGNINNALAQCTAKSRSCSTRTTSRRRISSSASLAISRIRQSASCNPCKPTAIKRTASSRMAQRNKPTSSTAR